MHDINTESELEIVTNTVTNVTKTFSLVTKTLGFVANLATVFVINKRPRVRKNFFGPDFALLRNESIKIMQIKSVYLQWLT